MPVQATSRVQGEPSALAAARQIPRDAVAHPDLHARIVSDLAQATMRAQLAIVDLWTGRHAAALCTALRLTNEGLAEHLGIAVRTVAKWKAQPDLVPDMELQQALDIALAHAPHDAQIRFALLLGRLPQPTPQPSTTPARPQRDANQRRARHDAPDRRAEVTQLLDRLMDEQNVSLANLARLTHFDKGYLSKIRNGLKPLSLKVATALDEALGAHGQFTALVSLHPQPDMAPVPLRPVAGAAVSQQTRSGGATLLQQARIKRRWTQLQLIVRLENCAKAHAMALPTRASLKA
ncbi:helix-turn-helix transcriptional regulator [Actinomadura barringtoniae]|uniref:Helix-turn-helix transcriptional regulator n=1 Tax=Actinomadura barringtoniae TaxID=1427535 RepID=A0A939T0M3_9ACTN|nr:helix-turn-helix transcriptional regulator [Actinomadura barringtoniae]MBO2445626.1 helix-turn-helix transcriptional regulator [Actinomadura barringtoniae]